MTKLRIFVSFTAVLIAALLFVNCTEDSTPTSPSIDYIAPYVEWITPSGSEELSGTVVLSFSVYDENGIDSVKLYINGGWYEVFGGLYYYPPSWSDTTVSIEWNTLDVEDGVCLLEIRVWDDSGNLGISPSLMVKVRNDVDPPPEDHTPPVVVWVSPEASSIVSGDVTLRFDAMDNTGIDSLKLYVNGACPEGYTLQGRQDVEYSIIWNTEDIEDGIYNLTVIAWDSSGNQGSCPSLALNVNNRTEDRIAPYVWWIAPEPGSTLNGLVNLRIGFYDENNVDSLNLLKNGAVVLTVAFNEDSLDHYWDTRADSDGVYIWEARAWDEAGNMGVSPSLLLRVQNNEEPPPEDRTPPVVVWVSPEPGTEVEGVVNLQFEAMDNDAVDSVKVYINGALPEGFTLEGKEDISYNVAWSTYEFEDGLYNIEVRAQDRSGNIGTAPSIILHVLNNPPREPRVIWVPDDYEKIQDAINASQDGDTVRVRAGVYAGDLEMWDKRIWLESEDGPSVTTIDASDRAYGIYVAGLQDTTLVIRGFYIHSAGFDGIGIEEQCSAKIFNCIIVRSGRSNIFTDRTQSVIINNVFGYNELSANIQTNKNGGVIKNNILIESNRYAIWNRSYYLNPVEVTYNLFFEYENITNDPPIELGVGNIYDLDPQFLNDLYQLSINSPCIDSGDPNLSDIDGSKSDIGAYGGPLAYPPQ
ncbi:MAG: hypothetical protein HQ568_06270 [Calditrichaeota bacterium]|nr:hypothetical protein [Calditrichota bacterium]